MVIVIPVFLAALVAVFLVVLVLFSGAILVAVLCLDKGWILAWSFVFFVAVLVGTFVALLAAWQRDCRLASRRHSSCLATALRSVPVNDRVRRSIVLWLKCVLQYCGWAWSWVGFGQSPFQCFCWI